MTQVILSQPAGKREFTVLNNITFSAPSVSAILTPDLIKIEGKNEKIELKIEGKKTVIQSSNGKYYSFLNYKIISLRGKNSIFYIVTDENGRKLFSDSLSFWGDLPHPLFSLSDSGVLFAVSPYDGSGKIISEKGSEDIRFFENLPALEERKLFIFNENDVLSIAATIQPPTEKITTGNVILSVFSLKNRLKNENLLQLKDIGGIFNSDGIIIANGSMVNSVPGDITTFYYTPSAGLLTLREGKSIVFRTGERELGLVNNGKFYRYTSDMRLTGNEEVALPSEIIAIHKLHNYYVALSRLNGKLIPFYIEYQNNSLMKSGQGEILPFLHCNGTVTTDNGVFVFGDNETILFKQK